MNDLKSFQEVLAKSKNVLIITGRGISAESGIPWFQSVGGFWRKCLPENLTSPKTFLDDPSLVWEFYEYRRRVAREAKPNKVHKAIADYRDRSLKNGTNVTIVTENIDELHQRAGTKDIIELHGSLFKTRCTVCHEVSVNRNIPICPALEGKGIYRSLKPCIKISNIPKDDLPNCHKENCKGLLRPHIVLYSEKLNADVIKPTTDAIENCDVCLVIGTTSMINRATRIGLQAAKRGIPVAAFNLEMLVDEFNSQVPLSSTHFQYYFEGRCTTTVSEALQFQEIK